MKLLIILPAFNVAERILPVLQQLKSLDEKVIIINDGSSDKTGQLLSNSGFQFITHVSNKGMGGAIKSGIRFGLENGYTHAISIDSDGQHDIKYIPQFIEKLNYNDFVLGNRFTLESEIPSTKVASNTFGASISNKVFNTNLSDVACGFRGYKLLQSYLEIQDNRYGFVFCQLFAALASSSSFATVQIPATYHVNELHATRRSEVSAFLNAILPYANEFAMHHKIRKLILTLDEKEDFNIVVGKLIFYGFYLNNHDAYFIQMSQN